MLMHQNDTENELFALALDLAENTSRNFFLTGKAGTGKTTFLKRLKETTRKKSVIVAPTGVAAINAGGVTMHSFFQLPMGVFLPHGSRMDNQSFSAEVSDRHSLLKNIRFNSQKRSLLSELELLIIDEVSMMRADMLDAIDAILRHFRRVPHVAFGGVQVIFIGDMYQLPPVVPAAEWQLMKVHYETPFFFSAHAIRDAQLLYVELKKIYRQNEEKFITLLNKVRNNQMEPSDFNILNAHFDPSFEPPPGDQYITVTTHNRKADIINNEQLARLKGKLFKFTAAISDDFQEKAYPTEPELHLKVGAQVMFVKNDSGNARKYFNGKMAVISRIDADEIKVRFQDGEELKLEKETWKNIRYHFDKEKDEVEEEVIGSFTQYPIRLAWAITVHKSQGLTFERAIIDAGESFAAGQVYVALSRCVSLKGLIIKSKLHPNAVSTDPRIIEFSNKEIDTSLLNDLIAAEKKNYLVINFLKQYDFSKLLAEYIQWKELIPDTKITNSRSYIQIANGICIRLNEEREIALKFQNQLKRLFQQAYDTNNFTEVSSRVEKATAYFTKFLAVEVLTVLREHIQSIRYYSKVTKYLAVVSDIYVASWKFFQQISNPAFEGISFNIEPNQYTHLSPSQEQINSVSKKEKKSATKDISLQLFQEGHTIEEIAAMRNLASGTIHSHLVHFVKEGLLAVDKLVETEKIDHIKEVVDKNGLTSMSAIKSELGDDYSFQDIKAVVNHIIYIQQQAV